MENRKANEELIFAAYDGVIDDIYKAIKQGAKLDYLDDLGLSALHRAAFDQVDPNVVDVLLSLGADINQKSLDAKRTALMLGASVGNTMVCQRLLERGAEYQCRDSFGWNALHLAIKSKNFETVSVIIQQAPDIAFDAPNKLDHALLLSQQYSLPLTEALLKTVLEEKQLEKLIVTRKENQTLNF